MESRRDQVHRFDVRGIRFLYHYETGRFAVLGDGEDAVSAPGSATAVSRALERTLQGHARPAVHRDWQWYHRMARNYVRWPTKGVELFLTERCNLRCVYCYARANGAIGSRAMSRDVLERGINFAVRRSGGLRSFNVSFFGGEPLLEMPLLQHGVDYARSAARRAHKRVRLSVTTNGTLLSESTVSFLRRHRFGITLSIDGPQAVQDRLRPRSDGSGSFDAIIHALELLAAEGLSPLGRSTLTPVNADTVAVYRALRGIGFQSIQLTWAEGKSTAWGDFDVTPRHAHVITEQEQRLADCMLDALSRGDDLFYNPFEETLRAIHSGNSSILPCGVTRAVTCVDVDGRLYPCHRFVGNRCFVMGTVDRGVDRAAHLHFLLAYFGLRYRCVDCWAHRFCKVRCPWYFASSDGTFHPAPPEKCAEVRRHVELCVWLYYQLARLHPAYLAGVLGVNRGAEGPKAPEEVTTATAPALGR